MSYEQFRADWYKAVTEAGMWSYLSPPTETVDLGWMSRKYEVYAHLGRSQEVEPFHVSARLSWTWDALQTIRSVTREEDLLMELLGTEHRDIETEQPWMRIDVTLSATLPWGSPMPMPDGDRWCCWVVNVNTRLECLLRTDWKGDDGRMLAISGRDEPKARVQPAADGRLYLTGVELLAWEGIDMPREWDDPDHEPDEDPYDDLADFVERVWEAVHEWRQSLVYLLPG